MFGLQMSYILIYWFKFLVIIWLRNVYLSQIGILEIIQNEEKMTYHQAKSRT